MIYLLQFLVITVEDVFAAADGDDNDDDIVSFVIYLSYFLVSIVEDELHDDDDDDDRRDKGGGVHTLSLPSTRILNATFPLITHSPRTQTHAHY